MTSIYILQLEHGCFYIGKSDNVSKRYQEHVNGKGSAWTRLHKPISLERTVNHASAFDEDKITKEYMAKYGIDKVRGGSYVQIELTRAQIEVLTREIRGAKDLCTKCGRSGHFVKDCYAKTDVSRKKIKKSKKSESSSESSSSSESESESESDSDSDDEFINKKQTQQLVSALTTALKPLLQPKKNKCHRCGRSGHYAPDCYASSNVNGDKL